MSEHKDEQADLGIEDLLREVGTRNEPPPEIAAAVRYAVHAEWQSMVAQRARRKRTMWVGMAASVAALAFAFTVVLKFTSAPESLPVQVASVVKADGLLQVAAGNAWRDVHGGETLMSGNVVRTGQAARAALNYNAISVRIDENTVLVVDAIDRITLERGRIYIDAPVQQHVPLTIKTHAGDVTHLGTQYQVQSADDKMVLSVREGHVLLIRDTERHEAAAGERVEIDAQGQLSRAAISPLDASWLWALQSAPSFDIENQSLAKFLEWVARETGKTIRYATPEVRRQAEELILRGSVDTLNPEQAFKAVMTTTGLTYNETASEIEVRANSL
jgi:ferric-dicitrate binding protein FerR (iron transport regulator)